MKILARAVVDAVASEADGAEVVNCAEASILGWLERHMGDIRRGDEVLIVRRAPEDEPAFDAGPLALVPGDDLIEALVARYDVAAFFGIQVRPAAEHSRHRVKGEPMLLLGMIEREKGSLLRDMLDGAQRVEGPEGDD